MTLIRWLMTLNRGPRIFIQNFRDLNASSQIFFILSTLLNNMGSLELLIIFFCQLAKKLPISLLCLFLVVHLYNNRY